MRVERPPADEEPPRPQHLQASVRRPMAGIGPEARLAGLDERTELRIIVPRYEMRFVVVSDITADTCRLEPV